jgi:hypothetical protein
LCVYWHWYLPPLLCTQASSAASYFFQQRCVDVGF